MLLSFRATNHPQQCRNRTEALSSVDDRALPPSDFAQLHRRFHFSIDVAASPDNAKLPRYLTPREDGLTTSWDSERVYCNPPFSNIEPWLIKAWTQTCAQLVVMLLPANRTELGWWQRWVEPYRDRHGLPLHVEFLPGRLRFLSPGDLKIRPNSRPPFRCCLLIWRWDEPYSAGLVADILKSMAGSSFPNRLPIG